jgi:hypothetical protein
MYRAFTQKEQPGKTSPVRTQPRMKESAAMVERSPGRTISPHLIVYDMQHYSRIIN